MKLQGIKYPFSISRGNGRVNTAVYDFDTFEGTKIKENIQQLVITSFNQWWGFKDYGSRSLDLMFKGLNKGFENLFKLFIKESLDNFMEYVIFSDAEFIFDENNRQVSITVYYIVNKTNEEDFTVIQLAG
jgi:hypothetical protein